MPDTGNSARTLSAAQIDQFVQDGFVKIDDAFPRELADEGRAILCRYTGCDPDDLRLSSNGRAPFGSRMCRKGLFCLPWLLLTNRHGVVVRTLLHLLC